MDFDDSLIGVGPELEDSRAATPELRLIAAVLERAVDDARRGDPAVLAWLASDDDGCREGWSYLTVCEHIRINPSWLRSVIADEIAAHPFVAQQSRFDDSQVVAA